MPAQSVFLSIRAIRKIRSLSQFLADFIGVRPVFAHFQPIFAPPAPLRLIFCLQRLFWRRFCHFEAQIRFPTSPECPNPVSACPPPNYSSIFCRQFMPMRTTTPTQVQRAEFIELPPFSIHFLGPLLYYVPLLPHGIK